MSNDYLQDLIKYRLSRAIETLDEAVLMKEGHHWNTCANRLYYACFYAVIALLEKHAFKFSKHSGVKSLFNRYFVKTGKIEKSFGKLFNTLSDLRQEGDYIDFVYYDADTIEPLIPEVNKFIEAITRIIEDDNLTD